MPPVTIRDRALWVGPRRVPILSGEMHYWRLSPGRWRRVLERWPQLGLGMVATYVPWEFHELSPGEFDFTGRTDPQRNLVGFLDLAREMGLDVFIRPGPYIYAEWTNAGVPDRVALLPRISRAYRDEALVWMKAVTGAILPYFATRQERFPGGGPIVLFQPDNEVDLFSHWFETDCGLDRGNPGSPSVPTSAAAASCFHEFLAASYADAGLLNRAWGTAYTSLDQAQPFAGAPDRADPRQRARALDYWRFQHWATAAIVKWHAGAYRSLGVDLPMVANFYPGGDVQNWKVLSQRGGVDMLAIDWYPRNNFKGPPAPEKSEGQASGGGGIFGLAPHREERIFMDTCRLQAVYSPIPWIGELECGVWHGYHEYTGTLTPEHYRKMYDAAMRAGVAGLNWYMFAGRDNWYYTPVNERGDLRPELAEVFAELHGRYKADDPPANVKPHRLAAVFEPEQIGTDDILADNPVLQAMHDSGVGYHMWDPDLGLGHLGGRVPEPGVLVYAAADWMGDAAQRSLLKSAAEGGKTLAFLQRWPMRDAAFTPCDLLGIPRPDRVLSHLGKKVEILLPGASAAGEAEGPVWVWDPPSLPRGATPIFATQIAGRQQAIENADKWMTAAIGRRWCVGWRLPVGRGAMLVLGVRASPSLIRALA